MTRFLPRETRSQLGVLVLLAGSVAAAVLVTQSSRIQALVSGFAFIGLCGAIVAWRGFRRHRRDLFAPPVLLAAYLALGIGIKGVSDLLGGTSKIEGLLDPTDVGFADLLTRVFLQTTLAVLAFLVGDTIAGVERSTEKEYSCPSPQLSRSGLRTALAISLAMTGFGIAILISRLGMAVILDPTFVATTGTIGLFWIYPLMFASISGWALIIIDRWSAGLPAGTARLAGLITTAAVVYFLTTSKIVLVLTVLYLMVGHHYAVRPVRITHILVATVGFLLALPMLYLHRIYGFSLAFLQYVTWGTAGEGMNILLGRSYLADSFAAVLYQTPRLYPFRLGATWLEIFYFWIPRGLWPGKPLTESLAFGATYLSSFHSSVGSFYAPTLMGDAYLNFGTVGVGAVFLVGGYGLRKTYDWLIGTRPKPEGVLLYSLITYWIAIGAEQSLAIVSELALSYIAPVALLVFVARQWDGLPTPPLHAGSASQESGHETQ